VLEATGWVEIPVPGQYTFGVNSDDGFGLTIAGGELLSATDETGSVYGPDGLLAFNANRGMGTPTLGVFEFDEAGFHFLRLVQWERGGGEGAELFAAEGALTAFDPAAFRLVGDTGNGGLLVLTSVPEPGTYLLLLLGALGLLLVRRKRGQAAGSEFSESVGWASQPVPFALMALSGRTWKSILRSQRTEFACCALTRAANAAEAHEGVFRTFDKAGAHPHHRVGPLAHRMGDPSPRRGRIFDTQNSPDYSNHYRLAPRWFDSGGTGRPWGNMPGVAVGRRPLVRTMRGANPVRSAHGCVRRVLGRFSFWGERSCARLHCFFVALPR